MGALDYKVAIVAEGGDGFGAAAGAALAGAGATVLLAGTCCETSETSAATLRARGLKADYVRLDTTEPMAWAVLVDKIMRTHGHLDILVNHAGTNLSTTIEAATAAQWRETLDANLIGPFLGIKAVIPAMRQSGGGAIINIAANPLVELLPLYALYGAAKAALVSLTKTTAVHCFQRSYDIRVNSVHPGAHETPLLTANALRSIESQNLGAAERATFHATLSDLLGAPPGALRNFDETINYLASDAARHVTGAALYCAGPLATLPSTGPPSAAG